MESAIATLLDSEHIASAILVFLIVAGGWFLAREFWPWLRNRIDTSWDSWIALKRKQLELDSERDNRFAEAWQDNNTRLMEMHMTIQTLVEGQKALIGTLLSFVDDRKLQDRLYSIFYEDGQ